MPQTATDRIIDAAAALGPADAPLPIEKRQQKRHDYSALVGLVVPGPEGGPGRTIVVRAADLSVGGLSVMSSVALGVGVRGAAQLVRSDGRFALVGFQVRHCRPLGNGDCNAGLQFAPLPDGLRREDFLDADGNLMLVDPLLRHNCT